MSNSPTLRSSDDTAPHGHKAPDFALAFGLLAAPLGWVLHLLINYAIAGSHCVGSSDFRGSEFGTRDALSIIFIVDLVGIALAASSGYLSFDLWKRTRDEKAGDTHALVHAGEGRTRFMAMCGILTSTLFGLATVVDALGSLVGPPC